MEKPTAYLNPCPSTPGHYIACDAQNVRVNSFAGPLGFMTVALRANGFRVIAPKGAR